MQFTQASLIVQGQNNVNQESIPVGCVPTDEITSTLVGGVGYTLPLGTPPPASQILPWIPSPPGSITTPRKHIRPKIAYPRKELVPGIPYP